MYTLKDLLLVFFFQNSIIHVCRRLIERFPIMLQSSTPTTPTQEVNTGFGTFNTNTVMLGSYRLTHSLQKLRNNYLINFIGQDGKLNNSW